MLSALQISFGLLQAPAFQTGVHDSSMVRYSIYSNDTRRAGEDLSLDQHGPSCYQLFRSLSVSCNPQLFKPGSMTHQWFAIPSILMIPDEREKIYRLTNMDPHAISSSDLFRSPATPSFSNRGP